MFSRERGPILLSNAACQWLGLIAVLCQNKAPVVGRFVASVTREEPECGEVEAFPIPETGDGAEMTESRHQKQKAITAPKKKRIQTKKAKSVAKASDPVDVTPETIDSKCQLPTTERTETDSLKEQNAVTSGETGQQTELGPFSKTTVKKRGKDGPIRKAHSTEIPQRKYYRPTADAKTYKMNGQESSNASKTPQM